MLIGNTCMSLVVCIVIYSTDFHGLTDLYVPHVHQLQNFAISLMSTEHFVSRTTIPTSRSLRPSGFLVWSAPRRARHNDLLGDRRKRLQYRSPAPQLTSHIWAWLTVYLLLLRPFMTSLAWIIACPQYEGSTHTVVCTP